MLNQKKDRKQYFNSLKISNWTYSQVIISAICYCLQDIFTENTEKLPKTIFWQKAEFPKKMQQKSLLFNLECFFYSIFDYVLDFETSEVLVKVFIETNIISVYRLEFIKALKRKFEAIDEKRWSCNKLNQSKNINISTLFNIFKGFNLGIIFPDKLVLHIVTWDTYNHYFKTTTDMLDVYKSFLEKLNLFTSSDFDSENFVEKSEIEKRFIINFFQLQTIDGIGIECRYGESENHYFIKLIEFFHTLFPSFSLEEIYIITKNQYLLLNQAKTVIKTKNTPIKTENTLTEAENNKIQ